MTEIHWGAWNYVAVNGPQCFHRRGPTSKVICELPPDHIVGRNHEPFFELGHFGRGPSGRWFSWALDLAQFAEHIAEVRRLRVAKGYDPDPPWWPQEVRDV